MPNFSKIAPCLWFDGRAEEAAKLYLSVFDGARLVRVTRYGTEGQETTGGKPGSVLTVELELEGLRFTLLNGGPLFKFTEALSLQVMCATQAEIDRLWDALRAGGDEKAQQCGWLKDRFGVSWQIVPEILAARISDQDPVRAGRVMAAMMKMKKLDIAGIEKAYAGGQ